MILLTCGTETSQIPGDGKQNGGWERVGGEEMGELVGV